MSYAENTHTRAANLLNDVRHDTEQAVLMVLGYGFQVGNEKFGQTGLLGKNLPPGLDGQIDILDWTAQYLGEHLGDFGDGHIFFTGQHVPLTNV